MISLNQRAAKIAQHMVNEREALGLSVEKLANGTTLIDAGIESPGSLEAARLLACACMGGLGQVYWSQQTFRYGDSDPSLDFWVPAVAVSVSSPSIACMASQYAGWAIHREGYYAIGSGPARALYADEEIYKKLDYKDRAETAVLVLEGRALPEESVAAYIADCCGVKPESLIILVAPTASLVGSVQIASRSAETGIHKLSMLGFDVRSVTAAFGMCPLAPVAADDLHAIGRTNDAILYGAQAYYAVHAADDELAALIERIPSANSPDYGTSFYELLIRHKGDFYRIDPMLFSPARVEINNLDSGNTFRAGKFNPSLLKASLLGP
jgi:methenyltetrahydromethanopterin cyclohydrolase